MATHSDDDLRFMRRSIEEAAKAVSEEGKSSPLVGAVLVKDGKLLAAAYRGELAEGDHAEYTILEKKLKDQDVSGATVYTTLEPCTERSKKKVPCVNRLIEKKVAAVVIGMLDPDPRIYAHSLKVLKDAGIAYRYYPPELRQQIEELNVAFIEKYQANPKNAGSAHFNYTKQDGIFRLGHGDHIFETKWSSKGSKAMYLYKDPRSIESVALAAHAGDFHEVIDATVYDFSSRTVSVGLGQIAILKNVNGFYAAVKVVEITNNAEMHRYELKFDYRILMDGSADFSAPEEDESEIEPLPPPSRPQLKVDVNLATQMASFHADKVREIKGGKMPIKLPSRSKLICHLIPHASFTHPLSFEPAAFENVLVHFPMLHETGGWGHRYNANGMVTADNIHGNDSTGYVQIYRNGIIESVADDLIFYFPQDRPAHKYPYFKTDYVRTIRIFLPKYLEAFKALSVPPPARCFFTLVGMKGVSVYSGTASYFGPPLDEDEVSLPPVDIYDFSGKQIDDLLKPGYDVLWNAGGYPRCLYYDESGKYRGQSY